MNSYKFTWKFYYFRDTVAVFVFAFIYWLLQWHSNLFMSWLTSKLKKKITDKISFFCFIFFALKTLRLTMGSNWNTVLLVELHPLANLPQKKNLQVNSTTPQLCVLFFFNQKNLTKSKCSNPPTLVTVYNL